MAGFKTPVPETNFVRLSFPAPRVLLVTMSRPEKLNAMDPTGSEEMSRVFEWLDQEPNLTVAVLTGSGRAFSAGADLKAWRTSMEPGADPKKRMGNPMSYVPLSRRKGKKPLIAAVNGLAMGGGCEIAVNSDLVIASKTAYFGLPEVKRGLSPIAGALPRLIRNIGLQRASELALTGKTLSADQALSWGLINKVVPESESVVDEAVKYASEIAVNSPDAIICTRAGLRQGWESAAVEDAVQTTLTREFAKLQEGENILEGLRAFSEKRNPEWKPSKL
ncbi:ClpP/crotonase-like domain-containing protein [Aspergillus ambiguus]|uniref:enoyl-CoA hydratase/isomerase family protein n=1 Tax=Aspergillus ambiguus TaxID=176160 RepID=UPI003CCDFA59